MKKLLLVAFVAVCAFATVSCSKEKTLNGTNWEATYTETQSMEGIMATMTMNMNLKFIDETKGSLTVSSTVSIPSMGINETSDPETNEFTYTFDGTNGSLTAEGESVPFTYNKKDNTINISLHEVDEETGESYDYSFTFQEK